MKEVAVAGIGMYPWGKYPDISVHEMAMIVAQEALKNAGMSWKDVQLVVAGEDPWSGIPGLLMGSMLSNNLGGRGIPIINVYNACATGGYGLKTAQAYITSGFCDIVLCFAASKSPAGFFGVTQVKEDDPNDVDTQRFRVLGKTNPTNFAMLASRRMALYGTTEEDLAHVKVKNSKHGALNPMARYKKVFTMEEVLNSPMVAYPLRLFEICATSDGAAAVVLCSTDVAKKLTTKPITLVSIGAASPRYPDPDIDFARDFGSDFSEDPPPGENAMGQGTARMAYEEAGIGPEDLSFAEVYDLSSPSELQWYEDIGLCKPGEGEKLLREGATAIGGRIPVCPSGGCSCFGEAIPAQALSQACELVWQLRGEAGERQVKDAKVGFAINAGKQGNCSAMIMKK
ncbi:lipid-transfer protein [Chloroflexota bacterium]